MVFWRRSLAYFLIFFTLEAGAFKAPVGYMQNTISGLIQQKAVKRGFASVDPRYGATLDAVSSVAGGAAASAATIVLAGVTAPAWVTAAITFGIGAVVTYGVSLAADGAVKWLFGAPADPKPVTVKGGSGSPVSTLVKGGPFWVSADSKVYGTDAQSVFNASVALQVPNGSSGDKYEPGPCVFNAAGDDASCPFILVQLNGTRSVQKYGGASYKVSGSPYGCSAGSFYINGVCKPVPDRGAVADQQLTVQQAIDKLPPAELAMPANPSLVASIADKLWRDAAAQPGYSGLPYRVDDPITETEVQTWRQANPSSYPTVQDLVKPQVSTNAPWTLPNSVTPVTSQETTAPSPSAGTNPAASNPLQNLGTDPGIGAPTLEQTPTAAQILKPIMDLMPGFKSLDVGSTGQCPKPEFDALGQHYVVDSHCGLLEQNRALLAAVMLAVWTLASAVVVLRA